MKYCSILGLFLIPLASYSQDYKGIWMGYMSADLANVPVLNVY